MYGGLLLLLIGVGSMKWAGWGGNDNKFPVFIVGLAMAVVGVIALVTLVAAQPL